MTLQNELAKIRKGKVSSVYLVTGTEQYLSDIFKKTLREQVLQDQDDEMNAIRFDMETTPISLALEEARTLPFFGDKRLVQVDNPYFLTGERGKGGVVHDVEELIDYLQHPLETTVLVIYAPYDKLDNRKKIVKELKNKAVLIAAAPMKEKETRQYVSQAIREMGYTITPEALEALFQLSNMDLSKIMGELEKLFLYTSENKKITKSMVESLVPKSLEQNVFELVEFVMNKKIDKALTLYRELLLSGEESIKLNAILMQHFRLLIQVKIMLDMGYQQSNIVDVLKIHPYRVKLAVGQVRRYQLKELGSIFDELVENDLKFKTGKMDKELLFELFLLKHGVKS